MRYNFNLILQLGTFIYASKLFSKTSPNIQFYKAEKLIVKSNSALVHQILYLHDSA